MRSRKRTGCIDLRKSTGFLGSAPTLDRRKGEEEYRMQIPVLNLPRAVPAERERQPQDSIPQTRPERERMKLQARAYVEAYRPVPPLSFEELRRHADTFIGLHA